MPGSAGALDVGVYRDVECTAVATLLVLTLLVGESFPGPVDTARLAPMTETQVVIEQDLR